jgi:excisionase family DNA binding protein
MVDVATTDLDRFITIREAAETLAISRATAYRMIAAGTFPVPVRTVGSKQVVSKRHVVDYVNGAESVAS